MTRRYRRARPRPIRGARARRGFAMFMSLGALMIIAVLVAASSFITLQETRLGQNSLVQSRAFAVAEYGLNKIQADWDLTPNLQMDVGDTWPTSYVLDGQGTCDVTLTRLNDETFWIVSNGKASVGNNLGPTREAVKRVGAILRLRIPTVNAEGAVTVNGNITIAGTADVYGGNNTPPAWVGNCPNPHADKAGIVYPPGSSVTTNGNPTLTGNPPTAPMDVAGNSETYVQYGDETWNTLKDQAIELSGGVYNAKVQPTLSGGSCNKANTNNWGEPRRASTVTGNEVHVPECENYFPIIYFNDDVSLTGGGRGQGILLVEGDLTITGGFEWFGLIIAKDEIKTGGGGAKIYGSIMAANAELDVAQNDQSNLGGKIEVFYSGCALERAMRGSAQVVQAKHRAWTELY